MNKFIYCLDEDLKNKLIKQGFKLLKEDDKGGNLLYLMIKSNLILTM